MPYIEIKFNSAKLIIDDIKNTSDVVCDYLNPTQINNYADRKDFVDINEIIKFEPISNLLHVLFGERPVPTNRITHLKRLEVIDDIVKNGYFKIDNILTYEDKQNKSRFITELTQGKKLPWNSHKTNKCGAITWGDLKRKLILNNYQKYFDLLNKINLYSPIKNPWDKISLNEVFNLIRETDNVMDLNDYLLTNKLTPLSELLMGKKDVSGFNVNTINNLSAKTINLFKLNKISLNGSFVFNVSNDMVQKLLNGQQVATYLDGGVAFLTNTDLYYTEYDLEFNNYIKIIK
jgi:hypothetical protein